MTTRGKAISVKIATAKVIKALEDALAKLENDYASQEANEAKYQESYNAWQKQLADYAFGKFDKAKNLRTNYRSYNQTLNIDFDIITDAKDFPVEPQKNYEQLGVHDYRQQKDEMTNAIRILKMTDEEVVNTSTYNAIARYL